MLQGSTDTAGSVLNCFIWGWVTKPNIGTNDATTMRDITTMMMMMMVVRKAIQIHMYINIHAGRHVHKKYICTKNKIPQKTKPTFTQIHAIDTMSFITV